MSGLTPNPVASGGATPGASITELAQQHGVSRESLVQFVQTKIQQTREANGQAPLDQSTLDQLVDHALERDGGHGGAAAEGGAAGSYTASAQRTPDRAAAPGHISILA
ncbi:MAG TPA: hypothetical protein VMB27_13115 [Solirubrobacteraceae bacterium]|nr:hypothetical protein [Solirubrobacteraceae bacterium]